jgi:hypothetical protein
MTGRCLLVAFAALASPIQAAHDPVSDAEEERLLLEGAIVHTDELPGGTSRSVQATLRLGDLEHQAAVHTLERPEILVLFDLPSRVETERPVPVEQKEP